MVFVFSLLGVELFNNYARLDRNNRIVSVDDPNGRPPTQNFDSFENSFVSVFVCLIGEDWQIIMHDYIRADQNRLIPNIFFIILMVIGHLFLMNLFLAILLKNFALEKSNLLITEDNKKLITSEKIKNFVNEQMIVKKLAKLFEKFLKGRSTINE